MTQREIDLKFIIHHFSTWEVNLNYHNSLNLQDGNIIAEQTICEILNCVFGYALINANSVKRNQSAVDLVDDENRIAFQVTTTNSIRKVQDTLNKFVAHNLHNNYDSVFMLILGKKQRRYPTLEIPSELFFDVNTHIIDFQILLNHINYLNNAKLSHLKKIFISGQPTELKSVKSSVVNLQKKALGMKKKFCKDFLDHELISENFKKRITSKHAHFNFGSAIIRQTGDRTFPGGDPNSPKWTKMEFHDLYDYGVEFIGQGGDIIIDEDGHWDLLGLKDRRAENPLYKKASPHSFLRLSYQDIEAYELESDGHYGYPTIFCDFKYDGWPFEEIKFGRMGINEEFHDTYYLDNAKRKKLS